MNDFTKEELEHLDTGLSTWMSDYNNYHESISTLRNKIRAMIIKREELEKASINYKKVEGQWVNSLINDDSLYTGEIK